MASHSLSFVLALVLTAILTPAWARFLHRRNIAVAKPRPRDVHARPTPRLGGVIVTGVFLVVVLGLTIFYPQVISLTNERFLGIDRNLFGLILGTFILTVVGTIDDLRGLRPATKLFWQVVAAAMLPLFGVKVLWLANPLGGNMIELSPLLDALLAIGWIVLMVNVINFLDGLDGLATGVSSIALATLYLLALAPFVNQPALALLVIILLGASLGFLPFNWHPARIFLGDSGSQTFGYLLAAAAIISGGKLATAALVLAIPILDALWAIIRRVVAGRSPLAADREHLHHRLFDLGLRQPVVVGTLMTISLIFGIIALSSRTTGKLHGLMASVIFMVVLLVGLAIVERLKKSNTNS